MCYVKQLDMPSSGFSNVLHATPRSQLSREIEKYGKPEIVPFDPSTVTAQMLAASHKRIAPKIITAGDLSNKKMAMDKNDCTIDNNAARIAAAAINLSLKVPPQVPIPVQARPLTSPSIMPPQQTTLHTSQLPQPLELVKIDSNGTLDLSMKPAKSPEGIISSSISVPTAPSQMTSVPTPTSGLIQLSVPQPMVQNPVSTLPTTAAPIQTPTILQIPRSYEQAVDYTKSKSTAASTAGVSAVNLTSPMTAAAAINLTIPTAIPSTSLGQMIFTNHDNHSPRDSQDDGTR